ncbi:hypothetical protein CDV55_101172 [Aspergillus turcosus]|nr:hypothetical protein CDV55_101172 [Aspergillus turcosus]
MAARQDSPILLHPGTTSPVVYLLNDWSFSLGVEILVPKGCEEVFQSSVLNWYNRGQLYNQSSSRKLVVRITAQDRMLRSAENFLEGFTSTTPSLVLPAPTNKRFSICKIVPFTARTRTSGRSLSTPVSTNASTAMNGWCERSAFMDARKQSPQRAEYEDW